MKESKATTNILQQWQAFRVVNLGKILGGTGEGKKEKGTDPRPPAGGGSGQIPDPNGSPTV